MPTDGSNDINRGPYPDAIFPQCSNRGKRWIPFPSRCRLKSERVVVKGLEDGRMNWHEHAGAHTMTRHCAGSTGPPSASCVLSRGHCDLFLQILTRRCACKRRTEASHRTLRRPTIVAKSVRICLPCHNRLPAQTFRPAMGMPTKVAFLTHMVGNQDPFLHCLQLVSVLS